MLTLRDLRRIIEAKYRISTERVIAEYKQLGGNAWYQYAEDLQRGESIFLFDECVKLLENACSEEASSLPDHDLELLWFESDHCLHFSESEKASKHDWIDGVSEELFSRVSSIAANEELDEPEDEDAFELTEGDMAFFQSVIELLQSQIPREDLTPRSRRAIIRAIDGLSVLPKLSDDMHIVITIGQFGDGGSTFQSILVSSDSLEFASGGSTYSPDVGSDSFTGDSFAWYASGGRDDGGDLENWFMTAEDMILAGATIKAEDEFDNEDLEADQ
jgi:hypothetical protein